MPVAARTSRCAQVARVACRRRSRRARARPPPARRPSSWSRCRPRAARRRSWPRTRTAGRAPALPPTAPCTAPVARCARAPPGARSSSRRDRCSRTRCAPRTPRRSRRRPARTRTRGRRPRSPPRAVRPARCDCERSVAARLAGTSCACAASRVPELELLRNRGAALAGDDVCADLGQSPLGRLREAVVERPRDRELQHAVAEELEALVRRLAVRRPRGVGEDVLAALRGKSVDENGELPLLPRAAAATGARRRSRRPGRRS